MTIYNAIGNAPILFDFEKEAANFKKRVEVRLRIADIDLLGWREEDGTSYPWSRIWIHPFAPGGLVTLAISKKFRNSGVAVTDEEGLDFKVEGDMLQITSPFVDVEVLIKYDSLFNAWKSFAQEVYEIVTTRQPEMLAYYYWEAIQDPYQYYKSGKTNIIPEPYWFEEDDGSHPEIDW